MPTPNMNLTLPTEGGSSGTWDELLNDALDLVDAHDHSTGKGVKVTSAGINVNADLEANGNSVTELRSVDFSLVASASMVGRVRGLWFNSADNELYIRTNGGTDIKLTSGGSINVSITGAIGGDYTSVSALLDYDDATDSYRLRQQVGGAVRQFARAQVGGVDLYEYKGHPTAGVPTTRVRLSSPAALGASYELTFAGALPGSTALAQVSAAGALTYSNTIGNAVVMSSTLAVTGAVTMSSTLAVTGLITATGGVTCAVNQHVTVSGTGDYRHGDRVATMHAAGSAQLTSGTATRDSAAGLAFTSAGGCLIPFQFNQGDRVKSLTLARFGNGVADISGLSAFVVGATGVATNIGFTTVVNPAASWADTTIDLTDTTLAAGESVVVNVDVNAAAIQLGNCRITWDRP